MKDVQLLLEDGTRLSGFSFGYQASVRGEIVFNTGMVGYPETLTDPSYKGQILTLTYPLIGNYGMPAATIKNDLMQFYESPNAQILGLVVADYSYNYGHWACETSLGNWLKKHKIPAVTGIDTRLLTKKLRDHGTMMGSIEMDDMDCIRMNPAKEDMVSRVSIKQPIFYKGKDKTVAVIDCGCKHSIIRSLLDRDLSVIRVPHDYDVSDENIDGVVISSGPGDPKLCHSTILNVKKLIDMDLPILGICLGHQILALASGADTYKLKFGHRSQNQPCLEVGGKRFYITSQNHGYAVDSNTLQSGFEPWFFNLNDGSNEGIRHSSKPIYSVQFHPEASPGPTDTNFIFDMFTGEL